MVPNQPAFIEIFHTVKCVHLTFGRHFLWSASGSSESFPFFPLSARVGSAVSTYQTMQHVNIIAAVLQLSFPVIPVFTSLYCWANPSWLIDREARPSEKRIAGTTRSPTTPEPLANHTYRMNSGALITCVQQVNISAYILQLSFPVHSS